MCDDVSLPRRDIGSFHRDQSLGGVQSFQGRHHQGQVDQGRDQNHKASRLDRDHDPFAPFRRGRGRGHGHDLQGDSEYTSYLLVPNALQDLHVSQSRLSSQVGQKTCELRHDLPLHGDIHTHTHSHASFLSHAIAKIHHHHRPKKMIHGNERRWEDDWVQ